jgi:Sir2- and TIR-associating SLOG family/SIR2-like domain
MTMNREVFLKEFMPKIESGEAAFFIGAGFSQSVGLANWKDLLREVASEINLDVERETDLVALAQYYANHRGNRSKINQLLIEQYNRDAKPHVNHRLLSQLPVHRVWTTNYDHLLEDAYHDIHKRVDVKITEPNLSQSKPGRDVTIFKMHGDIGQPQNAVLTRRDYDLFHRTRSLFSEALKGDFIHQTFLFLGFSFTDPNIDYVLSRIHVLLDKDVRDHYCIMRRPEKPKKFSGKARANYEYEDRKLEHRIIDLQQYGIQVILIDEYSEITEILTEMNRRIQLKNIFVSGSAYSSEPLGQPHFDELCAEIGCQIIRRGYNLTSGFGNGVGAQVLAGAIEEIYRGDDSISKRISLFPFPQNVLEEKRLETHTRYRKNMLSTVRFCIFLSGNKFSDGKVIEGPGVQEEFNLCVENKHVPIPIGATGHAALRFWELVSSDPIKYLGKNNTKIQKMLKGLGDSSLSAKSLVSNAFELIELLAKG